DVFLESYQGECRVFSKESTFCAGCQRVRLNNAGRIHAILEIIESESCCFVRFDVPAIAFVPRVQQLSVVRLLAGDTSGTDRRQEAEHHVLISVYSGAMRRIK